MTDEEQGGCFNLCILLLLGIGVGFGWGFWNGVIAFALGILFLRITAGLRR